LQDTSHYDLALASDPLSLLVVPLEGVPAKKIKKALLEDATELLAHRMGSSYPKAVLARLDGDWGDFIGTRDFASKLQERVVGKVDIRSCIA
jgi:Cys-tRNA synthase (O-phospho-L-seryl-tRNA:Cys-tRNA synthase)